MGKAHKERSQHLCALFAGGKGLDKVRELVVEARYICAKCGRAAHRKKNLCSAQRIEQA